MSWSLSTHLLHAYLRSACRGRWALGRGLGMCEGPLPWELLAQCFDVNMICPLDTTQEFKPQSCKLMLLRRWKLNPIMVFGGEAFGKR